MEPGGAKVKLMQQKGIGRVVAAHCTVPASMLNTRVGIKWLSSVCLSCEHCLVGRDVYCTNQKVSNDYVIIDSCFRPRCSLRID